MTTLIPKFDLMNGGSTPIGAINRTIFVKSADIISVKDFGATGDGTTNDRDSIQAALDYCSSLTNGCTLFFPTGRYKCNSGITINTGTTSVNFGGSIIDFTAMTTGNAISVITTITDGNLQNAYNYAHPIQNGTLYAYDATLPVTAFYFNNALNSGSGGSVKNISCVNFAQDVYFNNGAFCIEFEHCNFQQIYTSGAMTTYSITAPSASNSGERNSFVGCMWNNRNYVLNHANANANMFFVNCSFDYGTRLITITGGAVYLQSCHIENSSTTDYLFYVTGTNAVICLTGCDIITQTPGRTKGLFYSDSTCTTGGVCIDNCRASGAAGNTILVEGTGKTVIRNVMQSAVFGAATASAYQNLLAYGGFESANYTGEWTLAQGAVRSTAQAHTGSYSLSFPASSGVSPSATTTLLCRPGQSFAGQMWVFSNNIAGTGGTFYVTFSYQDKSGNNLYTGAILTTTTNISSWTFLNLGPQINTPAGTAQVLLTVQIFGVSSGSPTAYIDDVILNVY